MWGDQVSRGLTEVKDRAAEILEVMATEHTRPLRFWMKKELIEEGTEERLRLDN